MSDREVMKLAFEYIYDCDNKDPLVETLRQALERPQTPDDLLRQSEREGWRYAKECEAEVKRLRQALEQPEQETIDEEWTPCVKLPVVVHVRKQREAETHVSTREGITPVKPDDLIMRGVAGEEYPIGRELFERTYTFDTAPPKREWIGLTDVEIDALAMDEDGLPNSHIELARAIEARLKRKNKYL